MKEKLLIIVIILLVLGLILLGVFTYNLYQYTVGDKIVEITEVEKSTDKKEDEVKVDVSETKMTDEEILKLGKKLYKEAVDVIGNLTFGAEKIIKKPFEFDKKYPGYMKSTVTIDEMRNDILKDFTKEFKDDILNPDKKIPDKDIIRVADNKVFVVDAARGTNINYVWQDDLEIVNTSDDKIEFKVLKKYLSDEGREKYKDEVFPKGYSEYNFPDSDLKTLIDKFVIVKENGNFKISEFNLPY